MSLDMFPDAAIDHILRVSEVKTADIMVDIDDVVAPWFHTVDELCRTRWDAHHLPPCTMWKMWEYYGRTQEEWGDVVVSAIQHGLYTTVDPLPGSVEGINRLRWFGHRVHLVTARGFMQNADEIRRWTPEWLERFGVGYDSLVFSKDKVDGMITALGGWTPPDARPTFNYAIDDGGHNYDALDAAGVNVWLCQAPHNVDHPAERRIGSMWEFSQMILEETVPEHLLRGVEASA